MMKKIFKLMVVAMCAFVVIAIITVSYTHLTLPTTPYV